MPSVHPPTEPAPSPQRPSVGDQLKTAAASPLTPYIALITALTGMIGAGWQGYAVVQSTARVSYEALRAASEANTAAIEALRKGQAEQAAWVKELSSRLERKQAAQAAAVTPRPKVKPLPVEPPAPPAPPPPVVPEPTALPAFDKLAKAAP